MPARAALRILVAADAALGTALEAALAGDPELHCVGRVTSVGEVVAEARRHRPDVVLLGHLFGGGASLHVIADLAARLPEARVLVLSEVQSDILARESLRRGAAGFLVHSGNLATLVPRIHACIGRVPAERGVGVSA
jgi:two-component system, NarL family, response regulator DesR